MEKEAEKRNRHKKKTQRKGNDNNNNNIYIMMTGEHKPTHAATPEAPRRAGENETVGM
jgi:hypothetical protein